MAVGIDASDKASALAQMNVSRETRDRLDAYVKMLDKWRGVTNLISSSAWPELWSRHIADSAQLVALAPQARVWADLGSGAGLPGLIIAILLADAPFAQVHLIESDKRKAAFLIEAARVTGAPATVHNARIDAILPILSVRPDVITARALGSMNFLMRASSLLISQGTVGLFLKGNTVAAELTDVALLDTYIFELFASKSCPTGRIVKVSCR
jgi:16S rRNA (guanine527-N7)-methyltransferase